MMDRGLLMSLRFITSCYTTRGIFDLGVDQSKGLQPVRAFEGVGVSPWWATNEKICAPISGSSISTIGVWGQVTTPLESIEEGELDPAILNRDSPDP